MQRKFVIEFTVEDSDIQEWKKFEASEAGTTPDEVGWTAVDLIASQWATGDGLLSLTVTKCEEVIEEKPQLTVHVDRDGFINEPGAPENGLEFEPLRELYKGFEVIDERGRPEGELREWYGK